jgi:hypothetical protein
MCGFQEKKSHSPRFGEDVAFVYGQAEAQMRFKEHKELRAVAIINAYILEYLG